MQLKSTAIACWLLTACTVGTNQSTGGLGSAGNSAGTLPATAGSTAAAGASAVNGGTAGVGVGVAGSGVLPAGTGGSTAGALAPAAGSVAADSDAGAVVAGDGGGASGASGAAGGAGDVGGASGAAGGAAAPSVPGCAGSTLLAVPGDTSVRGPWPVGEKTVKFGRFSAVEIMYPAKPGSEAGKETIKYDLRIFLPTKEQSKVPDAQATFADQNTYRDLPIDDAHGPYPVVILIHGTSAYRIASFSSQAQWASRGFIVIAADHPNLCLSDFLATAGCGLTAPALDLSGDVDSELAAVTTPSGDLAFLTSHVDVKRVALVGHSAGAFYGAQYTTKPGVEMFIGLAGVHSANASASLKSSLYVAGIADMVLPYRPGGAGGKGSILYPGTDTEAYTASPGPPAAKKRLVGITAGGHLNVTDLCDPNPQGKSAIETAAANGVCGVSTIQTLGLADCGTIDRKKAITIVNDVTTAALEETLQCADRAAPISQLKSRYPDVGDFHEAVK
jgi:pimeloyl-ACP methyl ester carboxylesterase